MKKAIFLRYFGLSALLACIVLNIKMYIFDEWPTNMFFMVFLFGILLIGFSNFKWQKS